MSPAPFVVRTAVPTDGPVVRDFVFAILLSYGITPEPEGLDADVVQFGLPDNGALSELVADVEGATVGAVALGAKQDGSVWVSKLFVRPSHRGLGIGKALLARVVEESRARGHAKVWLQTRTVFREAVQLYESTGWRRGPAPERADGPDRTYWYELRSSSGN